MMLRDLIDTLRKYPPDLAVPVGFGEPYLYKGYPEVLAFRMKKDTTVGNMLAQAEGAVARTYTDCSGNDCKVSIYNDCWFDDSGEEIGSLLLSFMLGNSNPYKWTPVKDKLPPKNTPVLILLSGVVRIGELINEVFPDEEYIYWDDPYDYGQNWNCAEVTHWSPLLKPPVFNH